MGKSLHSQRKNIHEFRSREQETNERFQREENKYKLKILRLNWES